MGVVFYAAIIAVMLFFVFGAFANNFFAGLSLLTLSLILLALIPTPEKPLRVEDITERCEFETKGGEVGAICSKEIVSSSEDEIYAAHTLDDREIRVRKEVHESLFGVKIPMYEMRVEESSEDSRHKGDLEELLRTRKPDEE